MATDQHSVELVDDDVVKSFARAAVLAALMAATVFVGSIPIPFSPVPISLGVIVVYLAGLYLGPYWGAFSLLLYLTAGAVGLPVFAGGTAGVGSLLGPHGGYLWGFALGAVVVGAVVAGGVEPPEPGRVSVPRLVAALVAGALVVYAAGALLLVVVSGLSVPKAVATGVLVFVPGEILKMAAAGGIVRSDAVTAT